MVRLFVNSSFLTILLVQSLVFLPPKAIARPQHLRKRAKSTKNRLFQPPRQVELQTQKQVQSSELLEEECNITIGGLFTNSSTCQDERFYCHIDDGVCTISSSNSTTVVSGVCREKSLRCNRMYRPVCDCNNSTYSNECIAHGKGMNVARLGPCEE